MQTFLRFILLTSLLFSIKVGLVATTLPPGFEETVVVESINAGTVISILPDGRVLYTEQTGYIRMVVDEQLLPEPVLDISERMDDYWERGLIGLTYDSDFPHSPYLYLVYVAKEPYTHHVVSRFTLEGNRIDPASEYILLKGDDQSKIAGRVPAGHQGGSIRQAPDGTLYIAIGEHLNGAASQSLTTFQGKILRIHTDGSIPTDNPYYRQTYGKYRSIYSIGIRNPWGMDFLPGTDRLFVSDVGQSTYEEINEIFPGHNYGWPDTEGPSALGEFTNPVHYYPTTVGRCISGGAFYLQRGNYPDPWKGKYFFVDWASNWVKAIDVNKPDEVLDFATGLDKPVWNEMHPDGSMWVLNRGTIWRDGNRFEQQSGSLVVFRYTGKEGTGPKRPEYPERLSEWGVFKDPKKLVANSNYRIAKVNAHVWLPGVTVKSWMSVPKGQKIEFSKTDDWLLPPGAVYVQHYSLTTGASFETHVYKSLGMGKFQAQAYRWNSSMNDATLVEQVKMEPLPGAPEVLWYSPAPMNEVIPSQSFLGYHPQINTHQFNAGNQLENWNQERLFDKRLRMADIQSMQPMVAIDDSDASLELRVRSYLAANCANCHLPGGPSRGNFDARFETPLKHQSLIQGELVAGDMGIPGAKLVIPGDPDRSILLQRMQTTGPFKMPPVRIHNIPSPAIDVIREWILSLPTN